VLAYFIGGCAKKLVSLIFVINNVNFVKLSSFCLQSPYKSPMTDIRFEWIRIFFMSNKSITNLVCLVFHFGNAYDCVNISLVCSFRIVCLISITCVEENFEERFVRLVIVHTNLLFSSTICAMLLFASDLATGTVYNMLTGQTIPDVSLPHSLLIL